MVDTSSSFKGSGDWINTKLCCDGYFDCPDFSDEKGSIISTATNYNGVPSIGCYSSIWPSFVAWVIVITISSIVCILVMILVIKERERKILKGAAPPFLVTMLIGMIIVYTSIIIFVAPITSFMCSFQILVLC